MLRGVEKYPKGVRDKDYTRSLKITRKEGNPKEVNGI